MIWVIKKIHLKNRVQFSEIVCFCEAAIEILSRTLVESDELSLISSLWARGKIFVIRLMNISLRKLDACNNKFLEIYVHKN